MKKGLLFFWLGISVLATSWSLVHPGLFQLHDQTHASRISQMALAIQDAHFPVRWVKDFGVGYGMPLFEFYAPLPYYSGTVLLLAGLSMEWVIKWLMIISSLGTCVGAYLLGRWLTDKREAGWVSAMALTLAPYRAVNLFVRGALSETWGIMGAVWILAGLVMVVKQQRWGKFVLLFGWVILTLSHNLMWLMFLPMAAGFSLALWLTEKPRPKWPTLRTIALYSGLGLGLSAFYLVPLIMEKSLINIEGFSTAFNYSQHFVYSFQWFKPLWGYGGSAPLPYNDQSYFLGYPQLILAGLAVGWGIWQWWRSKKMTAFQWWLINIGGLLMLSLGLMHPRAVVVWDRVEILQILQFPWRWLSMAIIWLALLGALVVGSMRSNKMSLSLALVACLALVASNAWFFHPRAYLPDNRLFYLTDADLIRQQSSPGYIDYLPLTLTDMTPVTELVASDSSVVVTVQENTTRWKRLNLTLSQSTVIEFNVADFPHWQAKVDGQKSEILSTDHGTFKIPIPAGEHQVTLELIGSWAWGIGNGLTILSLLLFAILSKYEIERSLSLARRS